MANNYADKDEITREILNIQKREKARKYLKDIESLELQLKTKNLNEDEYNKIVLDISNLSQELQKLISEGADPNYNGQRFGEIVLSICDNLLKKPCFRNYSENWTEDFKSNAIYKIFKYINNFDPEKISKVTGEKISSFAYLTQITYMAFVEVINKRKKEEADLADNIISLQELSLKNYDKHINTSRYYPDEHEQDTTDYYEFLSVNDFVFEGNVCGTLLELLTNIRNYYIRNGIEKPKVHITYPSDYRISMDEYNAINELGFDLISLVKPKEKEVELELDSEDKKCFLFSEEEFEDWGEWTTEGGE